MERIINECEKKYLLKIKIPKNYTINNKPVFIFINTIINWQQVSIENNKYYHFSIPDGLQDGLLRKECNLDEILVF